MPKAAPLPSVVVTRTEAARILGVSPKRVTNMRWSGQLEPVTTPDRKIGLFDRAQVEALAAAREARQVEAERRRAQQPETPRLVLPPNQEASFEELMAAAKWTRHNPGHFVDTDGAAGIFGVTPQYVGRLAGQGRLAVAADGAGRFDAGLPAGAGSRSSRWRVRRLATPSARR
jgi:hypothetical protein